MRQVEHLVKRAKRGDAEAFIMLIEENKQSMYRVARGFLRDEEDATAVLALVIIIPSAVYAAVSYFQRAERRKDRRSGMY